MRPEPLICVLLCAACSAAAPPPPQPVVVAVIQTATPVVATPPPAAWITSLGATSHDQGRSVAIDAQGNVIVGGGSGQSSGFVAKLAPDGKPVWNIALKAAGVLAVNAVAVDATGNTFAAGSFTGELTMGPTALAANGHERNDVFVAKLDPSGGVLWVKGFGGTSYEAARAIAVDEGGNVYMTGTYQRDLDFGGGMLDNAGVYDIFVAELDPTGKHVFSRGFAASGATETTGTAIGLDASSIYIAGNIDGQVDFGGGPLRAAEGKAMFALKVTRQGRHVQSSLFAGRGDAHADALAVDASGGLFVTGGFSGTIHVGASSLDSAGATDAILIHLDAAGAPTWSKRFGGTGYDEGRGVAVDAQGGVYLAATVEDNVDLGEGVGAGKADALVAKLDANGAPTWVRRYGSSGIDLVSAVAVDRSKTVAMTGGFADAVPGLESLDGRDMRSGGFVLRFETNAAPPAAVAVPKVLATEPGAAAEQAATACEAGDLETVKALVPSRVPATATKGTGWTLVMTAASKGKADVVRYLVANGADPNTELSASGYNTLMQAARWGYLDTVRALIELGAKPNAGDTGKQGTALHIAVSEGKKFPAVTEYLLAHGARTDTRDTRGRSPLFAAVDSGNDDGARALLDAKAALEVVDDGGHTALTWAAVKGDTAIALELLKRGAKADPKDKDGATPIFHASHGGSTAIVEALLAHGAAPNPKEAKFGDTALMRAANNGHLEIVELLLAKHAPVNQANNEGLTAAHMAARNGHDAILTTLAKHGANFQLKDKQKRDVAALAGSRASTTALVHSLTK